MNEFFEKKTFIKFTDAVIGKIKLSVVGFHNFNYVKSYNTVRKETGYALHFIIDGEGEYILDNKKYFLSKNTFFITPPQIQLTYYPSQKNPWKYVWFFIEGDFEQIKQIFDKIELTKENPFYKINNFYEVLLVFQNLFENETCDDKSFDMIALSSFFKLMHLISLERFNLIENNYNEYVEKMKKYIKYFYYNPNFKIKDLSDQIAYSYSYTYKLFYKYEGISLKTYLGNYRIKKACELLLSTNMTVKEIAFSVGYNDEVHFIKQFKKNIGLTPGKYQEKNF